VTRSFYVQIIDGPAAGWGYYTSVPPDRLIAVAPQPGKEGQFMRVLLDGHPWEGERRYRLIDEGVLALGVPLGPEHYTEDGDLLCSYRVVE
jgi:hypothetical protein